jgi:hypothetical protein
VDSLHFPAYRFRIVSRDGKLLIFDRIRKKYVALTPEEWVRQHLVQFLISERNCPRSLIRIEQGIRYAKLPKRVDVLVYGREGEPWMIAECKAPDVPLLEESARQLAMYNSALKAQYILLTNGLRHFCFQSDYAGQRLLALPDVPYYPR